jgi:hypothetical protein
MASPKQTLALSPGLTSCLGEQTSLLSVSGIQLVSSTRHGMYLGMRQQSRTK